MTIINDETKQLKINPHFSINVDPFDTVTWAKHDSLVKDKDGNILFEQKGVEYPEFWSQQAINIVSEKYFAKKDRLHAGEKSLKELIIRVSTTIQKWGVCQGYFDEENSEIFCREIQYLILHQFMAFNSPVFFNLGLTEDPMISACFIQGLEDSMSSIMELVSNEAQIFQNGGGTGTNFSVLRGSTEPLSTGGTASGPVSFMRGFDSFASVIKSGGRLRRAAKMIMLDVGHPDIEEFLWCKALEEKRLQDLTGDRVVDFDYVYNHTYFQNGNNSIRLPQEFLKAVVNDGNWWTKEVTTAKKLKKYKARELLMDIAEAAHICGDPGIQYHTTINQWNTLANSGEIVASNPCSEYMSLNDSACNLASLNLIKFTDTSKDQNFFDVVSFKAAIKVTLLAQEILVGKASYPTVKITEGARKYRQLGLGYANLGGLLMALGHPYDSDYARSLASAITSILTASAYDFSADMALAQGPFDAWEENKEPFIKVLNKHLRAHKKIIGEESIDDLLEEGQDLWVSAIKKAKLNGMRNSQVTLLAPTGTIGYMMEVATTGVEPDLFLVKNKALVGGGNMRWVNNMIPIALTRLKYTTKERAEICAYVEEHGYIEGAPHLLKRHLSIFDCAIPLKDRFISPDGHIKMMAAVQPFLSGAISKTVNLPSSATVQEIYDIYLRAWKLGLKSIAVYRDNSKIFQPMSTTKKDDVEEKALEAVRHDLPDNIQTIRHKFNVAGHKGYIHVGLYEDGSPGELFIRMAKAGSTINGLMDNFGIAVSLGLQYGVPLDAFIKNFENTRFEPQGWTNNEDIRFAKSLLDYIFKWFKGYFFKTVVEEQVLDDSTEQNDMGMDEKENTQNNGGSLVSSLMPISDGPPCPQCGFLTVPNGTCYRCPNCGSSLGCS